MSVVTLVSGGLDSTLMAVLAYEAGITQHPLFIDYGQRASSRELNACLENFSRLHLPAPEIAELPGYGRLISSGLTDPNKRILEDAFLPCRNAAFLTVAAGYAVQRGASSVAIGLLDDAYSLFPDQTRAFLREAETFLSTALGESLRVVAPLISFTKADVVAIAREKNIRGTYSCHAGSDEPCGKCVACREYIGLEV